MNLLSIDSGTFVSLIRQTTKAAVNGTLNAAEFSGKGTRRRFKHMKDLARTLLGYLEGILDYCRTNEALGVVEAIKGGRKTRQRLGRGHQNLNHLCLKLQRQTAPRNQFVSFQGVA